MSKYPPFAIHKIHTRDVSAIIQIADECRLSPWSVDDYRKEAKRDDSIMLRLENAANGTIGFIVGRCVPGSGREGGNDAELYNIGITTRFQGAGCGSMLLEHFLESCKVDSVRNIWLDVRVSNLNAIAFYKKFGFSEFALRKQFYADPVEDGIVMKLFLH